MNEIQEIRTLDVVAAEIRAFTASMLGNIIEIGRRLCEAKEMLPYGEFGAWVETNTGYGKSTANNFMRLFEEYGSKQNSLFGAEVEDVQTFGKLSYSKALALLALPSGEREEFVEAHDVEAMTTRELQQAIRERDEAIKQAEAARRDAEGMEKYMRESAEELSVALSALEDKEAEAERADQEIVQLKAQVKELESRPVEVAVQEPDPEAVEKAVAAAVAEAGERHRSELEKLQKTLEAAEKARDKAKDEAKKAGEKAESAGKAEADKLRSEQQSAQAEAARYRAEAEELRKQLAMSGEAVTSFKLHFSAWQRAYADMEAALERADEETAGKLRAAVAAQIKGWGE